MADEPITYREGQTATSKDKQRRVVFRSGQWVNDPTYVPPAAASRTSAQDRQALNAASARAASERDAQRTYSQAARALDNFAYGTGPVSAWYLDAITPNDDASSSAGGGFAGLLSGAADSVGAFIGTPLRALVSQDTLDARDHLRTVNAQVALAGSQQMKGSSSDKDTALMRLSGIGPYKGDNENRRIIREATYQSGLEQARAGVTSWWIGKYGSLSSAAPNGMTFEQALGIAERSYSERTAARRRGLPQPPPGGTRAVQEFRRRVGNSRDVEVTIDESGREVR